MPGDIDLNAAVQTSAIKENTNVINSSFEGLTKPVDNISKNVANIDTNLNNTGWFHEMLQSLVGDSSKKEAEQEKAASREEKQSAAIDHICEMTDIERADQTVEKSKKTKTSGLKIDDLKDMSSVNGIGFALLATQLSEISGILKKKNDNNSGKGSDKVKNWFEGLMGGVAGIAGLAVALTIFAGATSLFQLVNWSDALLGLVSFTGFTVGMVFLAKSLNKEEQDLTQFAVSSTLMSSSLAVFAISLALTSQIFKGSVFENGNIKLPAISIPFALAGIAAFYHFELLMAKVANKVNKDTGDFSKFAAGSFIMSFALVAFSASLVLTSAIMSSAGTTVKIGDKDFNIPVIDLISSITAIGLFLAFESGLAIVARIAGNNVTNFSKFAVASMAMTGALAVFSVGLYVVGNILKPGDHEIFGLKFAGTDINAAIVGVNTFLVFLAGMALLGHVAQTVITPMAALSGVSMIMSVAIATFGISLTTLIMALNGGKAKFFGQEWDFGPETGLATRFGTAMAGLGSMVLFFAAFAAAGFAAAAVAAPALLFSAAMLPISMATMLGAQALALASLLGDDKGGKMLIAGKEFTIPAHNIEIITKGFDHLKLMLSSFADLGEGKSFSAILKAGFFGKMMLPIIEAINSAAEIIVSGMTMKQKVIKEYGESAWNLEVLDHVLDPVLAIILGKNFDGTGGLINVVDKVSFWAEIKLQKFTKVLGPIIDSMYKAMNVVSEGISLQKKLESEGVKLSDTNNILYHTMDPILFMIMGPNLDGKAGMSLVADQLGFFAKGRLIKFVNILEPITNAIQTSLDVVKKAASTSKNGTIDVEEALKNVEYIMLGKQATQDKYITIFGHKIKVGSSQEYEGGIIGIVKKLSVLTDDINSDVSHSVALISDVVYKIGEISSSIKAIKATPAEIENAINIMTKLSIISVYIEELEDQLPNERKMNSLLKRIGTLNDLINPMSTSIQKISEIAPYFNFLSLKIPNLEIYKISMSNFAAGTDSLRSTVNKFDTTKLAKLNSIGEAMSKIANASEKIKLDTFDKLLSKASELQMTADQMERIASAFEKMSHRSLFDRMNESVDNLKENAKSIFNWTDKSSPSEIRGEMSASNYDTKEAVNRILDHLIKWDKDGINVNIGAEKKQTSRAATIRAPISSNF